jgi:hypothetical protein
MWVILVIFAIIYFLAHAQVWNPILYALLNLQLRAAFVQLLPITVKRCLSVTAPSETGTSASGRLVTTNNNGTHVGFV